MAYREKTHENTPGAFANFLTTYMNYFESPKGKPKTRSFVCFVAFSKAFETLINDLR